MVISMEVMAQACGSGGTAAGLALGMRLSGAETRVHAFGVCDDEDYFYDFIDGLLSEMDPSHKSTGEHGKERRNEKKGLRFTQARWPFLMMHPCRLHAAAVHACCI